MMETFSELINSEMPVLVDFYADWCGPCKSMEPVVKDVARMMDGKARVIKIDIDKTPGTARAYEVMAVPTFIIFRKGKIIWRHPGMIDKSNLLAVLARHT